MRPPNAQDLTLAIALALEAGELLKKNFGEAQEIDYKGRINLVTRMDHESEEMIVGRIREFHPDDDVVAEEGHGHAGGAERVWIVDPLDGTVNYAHEYPVWSVSIALQVAGRLEVGVVYNPLLDELYAGRRGGGVTLNGRPRRVTTCDSLEKAMLGTGFSYDLSGDHETNNLAPFGRFLMRAQAVRRAGSAALAIAKVAVGRSDGFWERNLQPWDMAAAALLVEEAGGRLSDYDGGGDWLARKQLVASNGPLHDPMLSILRDGAPTEWGLPSAEGDPPPRDQMMVYFVGYLFLGPNQGLSEAEGERVQKEHLAYNRRQKLAGRYVLVGPFADREDPRGLIVMKAESIEAAREMMSADPAVRAGVLRVELRPWYAAKGITAVPPPGGE
ncbi:MAG TPA: inositol monophosphatase family protein [Candidatus Eisenbacteria bacterium]|nr:inositol monophosphatase family protein [Candidatus Eisenbacteria bacterium]